MHWGPAIGEARRNNLGTTSRDTPGLGGPYGESFSPRSVPPEKSRRSREELVEAVRGWARPRDYAETPRLFTDGGVEPCDARQGLSLPPRPFSLVRTCHAA